MKRFAMFAVFLLVFTGVFTALHYYVLGRLVHWFGGTIGLEFVVAMIILILSFPVANVLAHRWTNRTTDFLYDMAAIWMGSITILLLWVVVAEVVRVFTSNTVAAWTAVVASAVTILYALWNGTRTVVKEYTIAGNVKKAHRVALASDVHAGPVHGIKYVRHIVQMLKEQKPDMVLLPGDLLDGPGKLPDDILEPFKDISVPIYYSFGNHEEYVGADNVERVAKGTGINTLRDEAAKDGEITIVGIDDREDRDAVKKYMPETKGYTILMYHRPEGLSEAAKKGVDLMVSGHTHYGQIFPFTLLVKLRFARIRGWYSEGKTKHFVSTGAGTWGPPMRLGSHNEIVLLTIEPEKS